MGPTSQRDRERDAEVGLAALGVWAALATSWAMRSSWAKLEMVVRLV
jgi:hypothetical protein